MPKHAPNVPKGTPSDRSDERIGLTEAFSPVGDAQARMPAVSATGATTTTSTLMPSRLLSRLTLLRSCSATIP